MGPTLPRLSPYLGVLHQAGHGLFCSTSICLDQPEGTEDGPACSVLLPQPRLCRAGAGLAALSGQARLRETGNRQAQGWAQDTHKVWGFRKYCRANSCMV